MLRIVLWTLLIAFIAVLFTMAVMWMGRMYERNKLEREQRASLKPDLPKINTTKWEKDTPTKKKEWPYGPYDR